MNRNLSKFLLTLLSATFAILLVSFWIFSQYGYTIKYHVFYNVNQNQTRWNWTVLKENEIDTSFRKNNASAQTQDGGGNGQGIELSYTDTVYGREQDEILEDTRGTLNDLNKYFNSEIRNMKQFSGNTTAIETILNRFDKFSREYFNSLEINLKTLENSNDVVSNKRRRLRMATDKIQKKILNLQNDPSNCVPSKVLLCNLTNVAGFASGIHDVLSCFVEAFYSGLRVVLDNSKWHYTPGRTWSSVGFRRLSDICEDQTTRKDYQTFGPPPNGKNDRFKVYRLPQDIKEDILSLGVDPFPWWWGQFVGYILRGNDNLSKYIQAVKKNIGFKKPIVGIQIRRSDKVGSEAGFHSNEEYMKPVEDYFDKLDMVNQRNNLTLKNVTPSSRTVFVATDDPTAFKDLKEKFPGYTFIFQEGISKLAQDQSTRYNNASLYGVLVDLYLLADSDFLVCTLSSGLGRLAFELSNYLKSTSEDYLTEPLIVANSEVLSSVYSLDVPHHYAWAEPPRRVVIHDHMNGGPEQLTAVVGDVLELTDPYAFDKHAMRAKVQNGFSQWKNVRTGKVGTIPSFKMKVVYDQGI